MNEDEKYALFMERLTEAQPALFRFVAAMLPGYAQEVDDLSQDVNLLLIRHAKEYDPARPFHAWMLVFARNAVINFLAKEKRAKVVFSEETVARSADWLAEEAAEDSSSEPLLRRLSICKAKLKPEQRKLIDLRYVNRYPLEKIGIEMRLKLSSVHDALVYVRSKLSDCMKRLCALDDTRFEQLHGDSFSKTLSDCLDGDSPSQEHLSRLIAETSASDENLKRYLDQMLVHVALSHRFLGREELRFPAAPRRTVSFRRIALVAACLALLAGGGLLLRRKATAGDSIREQPAAVAETRAVLPQAQQTATACKEIVKHGDSPVAQKTSAKTAEKPSGAVTAGKERKMKAESIVKAAAVAAVTTAVASTSPAPVVRAQTATPTTTVESSVGISLDARPNVPLEQTEGADLEARDRVEKVSAQGYNLNATKFKGFVIMLK